MLLNETITSTTTTTKPQAKATMINGCEKRTPTPQAHTFSFQVKNERNPVPEKKSQENGQDKDLNRYPPNNIVQ